MVGLCVEDAQVEACSAVSFLEMVEGRVKLSLVATTMAELPSLPFSASTGCRVQGVRRDVQRLRLAPSSQLFPMLSPSRCSAVLHM